MGLIGLCRGSFIERGAFMMFRFNIIGVWEDEYGTWIRFECGCRAFHTFGLHDMNASIYVNVEDHDGIWGHEVIR